MHLASIRSPGICLVFFPTTGVVHVPLKCFKVKSYQGQQYTNPTDFISAVNVSLKHTVILKILVTERVSF